MQAVHKELCVFQLSRAGNLMACLMQRKLLLSCKFILFTFDFHPGNFYARQASFVCDSIWDCSSASRAFGWPVVGSSMIPSEFRKWFNDSFSGEGKAKQDCQDLFARAMGAPFPRAWWGRIWREDYEEWAPKQWECGRGQEVVRDLREKNTEALRGGTLGEVLLHQDLVVAKVANWLSLDWTWMQVCFSWHAPCLFYIWAIKNIV